VGRGFSRDIPTFLLGDSRLSKSTRTGEFLECPHGKKVNIKITNLMFVLALGAALFSFHARPPALAQEGSSPSPGSNSRTVWDGVFTVEQADRGHSVYHAQCEVCHAEELTGADEVPPLAGPQFLANWNGLTLGDLFERIRKTMPANDPGKLTRDQNADVISYLLAFNMFPAGKKELAPNAELLKQIRIEATKPDPHDDRDK
jgi:S-disulfanyl-L-cysteine oxidoreductase SoxD